MLIYSLKVKPKSHITEESLYTIPFSMNTTNSSSEQLCMISKLHITDEGTGLSRANTLVHVPAISFRDQYPQCGETLFN